MKPTVAAVTLMALILVCLLMAPYWFGVQSEKLYNQQMDSIEEKGSFEFERRYYKRGWLSSQAGAEIHTTNAVLRGSFTSEIDHGPFPLLGTSDWLSAFDPALAIINTRAIVGGGEADHELASPFTVQTRVDMEGNTVSRVYVPDKQIVANGANLGWRGLRGEMMTTPYVDSVTGSFRCEVIAIDANNTRAKAGGITINMDLYDGTGGLILGEASLEVVSFEAEATPGERLSVDQFELLESTQERNGALELSATMKFDRATQSDTHYGPGTIRVELTGLDAAQFAQITIDAQRSLLTFTQAIRALGAGQPRLQADLDLRTDHGVAVGTAAFSVDANKAANGGIWSVFGAVDAVVEFSAPERLVSEFLASGVKRQLTGLQSRDKLELLTPDQHSDLISAAVGERLAGLLAKKQLIRDGDRLALRAKFTNGQLRVNGELVPLIRVIH